ncbi:hypothetical protein DK295_15350, partial [Listeria monocytogenes]
LQPAPRNDIIRIPGDLDAVQIELITPADDGRIRALAHHFGGAVELQSFLDAARQGAERAQPFVVWRQFHGVFGG